MKIATLVFACLISCSKPHAEVTKKIEAQKIKPSEVVIVAVEGANGPSIWIDGKEQKDPTYYEIFAPYIRVPEGLNRPISLYASDHLKIVDVNSLIGELQAVGFLNISTYEFNSRTRTAIRITFEGPSRPLPFNKP